MKFISFLASSMLIALISQYSTMALPLNDTTISGLCSEGYEMIEGHCMPIKTKLNDLKTESSTLPSDNMVIFTEKPVVVMETTTLPLEGGCPEGSKHGEHGICQPIKLNDQVKITDVPPVPETTTLPLEGGCPEGFEHGEHGICQPIKLNDQVKVTHLQVVETATYPLAGSCREGWEHGEHGICQPITLSDQVKVTDVPPVLKTTTPLLDGSCPEGWQHGEHGICQPVKLNDQVEVTDVPPVVETTTLRRYGGCREGWEHGEHGICQPIKLNNQVEVTDVPPEEETTTLRRTGDCRNGFERDENGLCQQVKLNKQVHDTNVEPVDETSTKLFSYDIPKGCPEGTEADEQGACIEKKPRKNTKTTIDPKFLLNKDGSCPENYKMIQGHCLYIKPKQDASGHSNYLASDHSYPSASRPASSGQYVLVPVLSDNSCPEGTEYSDYGLCRRRSGPLNVNVVPKSDTHCPTGYEFIKGKCTPKKSEVEDLMDLTTKFTKLEKPIVNTEVMGKNQPIQFTTETYHPNESRVKSAPPADVPSF